MGDGEREREREKERKRVGYNLEREKGNGLGIVQTKMYVFVCGKKREIYRNGKKEKQRKRMIIIRRIVTAEKERFLQARVGRGTTKRGLGENEYYM